MMACRFNCTECRVHWLNAGALFERLESLSE
jgi:hypothetical protein